jgi:hypothetical protein
MFVPPGSPENSNCTRHQSLILFIFLFLGLPVSAFAKGVAGSDINLESCIQSFTWQLEDPYWRGQNGRRPPGPPPIAADSSAHENCVEFLVQMLENYDEQYQLQRGKPPPPPPPPSSSEPAARAWHAFSGNGSTVADASRLYLFAGSGSDWQPVPGDLWYYRVDSADWILAPTGTTQPGRRQHVGFSCGAGQCVSSNGNNGVGLLKETWIYTEGASSWSQINCKRNLCPSARLMPTMAYDPARSYHLLFGGAASLDVSLNDTYTFKGGRWTARNPLHKPGARHWAATAFAKAPVNKVVLFGGLDGPTSVHCDMYAWTDTDWQQVAMTNTGPCLYAHSMAWDEAGKRLIVTGGYLADRTDTPNPDVWYFKFNTDGGSGTWSKEPAGSALATCAASAKPGARMTYDVPSGDKVFFGGEENINNVAVRYDTTVVCH